MKGEENLKFKYNPYELASLTRIAVGPRTIAKFSSDSGISKSALSRILNCSRVESNPPTLRTLMRIAMTSKGRVKCSDLLKICGYEISEIDNIHLEAQEEKNNTTVIISDDIQEIWAQIKEIFETTEVKEKNSIIVLMHNIKTLVLLKSFLEFKIANNIDIKCGLLVD